MQTLEEGMRQQDTDVLEEPIWQQDTDNKEQAIDVRERAIRNFKRPPYYGVMDQLKKWGVDVNKELGNN